MTIVEFYDKDSAENIAAALICEPDRIVFIGDSEKQMLKSKEIYRSITSERDLDIEFIIRKTSKNNLKEICNDLIDIVNEFDDCIFDLNGGEDLFLVAAGIVHNMFKDRVKLQNFNIASSMFTDCVTGEVYNVSRMVKLGVEENVSLYGGKILNKDDDGTDKYFAWNIDDDFADDIFVMWSICKKDPHNWNRHTHTLGNIDSLYHQGSSLSVDINAEKAKKLLASNKMIYFHSSEIMSELSKYGLVRHLYYDRGSYTFSYKNEQVRKCLTKAGQLLELYVTLKALDICDREGEPFFNDVMTGVSLDWDGIDPDENEINIENEIDVILMKDMVPIFISCKNGLFTVDELYKLSSVADKFGGRHARKVLITTDLERNKNAKYIVARAHEMRIRIVENVHEMSSSEFDRMLRSLHTGA